MSSPAAVMHCSVYHEAAGQLIQSAGATPCPCYVMCSRHSDSTGRLPCAQGTSQLLFARPTAGIPLAPLIEKGVAKFVGSYADLEGDSLPAYTRMHG